MAIYGMAKAKIYIGTQNGAVKGDLSSYVADTYVQVGEVESIDGLDDIQNFAEFIALADARARQVKTTKRAENLTLRCAYDPDDAGQDAVRAAAADDTSVNYNIKIQWNDGDTSVSPNVQPSVAYLSGLVGNDPVPGGDVGAIAMVSYTITNNTGFTVVPRA